jgi:alpha-amylase
VSAPLRLVAGFHLHQPVGNFDHVFREHADQVYRPLLAALAERALGPWTLHLSGPLLAWLEAHDAPLVDAVGRLVADGRLDLWCAGVGEPVLAAWSDADRVAQVAAHRAALRHRFGVDATGLWLTERVWEPDLPRALAAAGVRYAVVDDRHLLAAGIDRHRLDRPWRTEHGGAVVDLLPIDERLRYLLPFRPWDEIAAFLRARRDGGAALAVFADDGEKFGGWPGTAQWVWRDGWMAAFLDGLAALVADGVVALARGADVLRDVPGGGLAYLPTASYREMETWALPPDAARRLLALEADLGEARVHGPDGALVRGGHWRGFLAKYPEANRLHKHVARLSALARERGDPPAARAALARAQCNDAYWHGVFGGLYLPFLRAACWREAAVAERVLRAGEPLAWTVADGDADGHDEIYIHSATISVTVAPARGGAVETWLRLADGVNLADTLTRRVEAYHHAAVAAAGGAGAAGEPLGDGTASIHDLERALVLDALPPADLDPRAIGVERVLAADVTDEAFRAARYAPLASTARTAPAWRVEGDAAAVTVVLTRPGLEKRVTVHADGRLTLAYTWDPAAGGTPLPPDARFTVECSLATDVPLDAPDATVFSYPIETVAKSERGFDRTVQGIAVVCAWPVTRGHARVVLGP